MLELYHAAGSVCAQKVRFALALKGIGWGDRLINLDESPQYAPDYLKLNPKAVVPTLVHDGRVVRENRRSFANISRMSFPSRASGRAIRRPGRDAALGQDSRR